MMDRPITTTNKAKRLLIGCPAVMEDIRPLLPPTIAYRVLDFGLYRDPSRLRNALQQTISESSEQAETIILAYGLCSQGVVGLRASSCTLVVPRVDDCISMFLGSNAARQHQSRLEPGTYYLTKGWIKMGQTPFSEYNRMIAKYGQERADKLQRIMLKGYKRLAFINTSLYELQSCREYAHHVAERFELQYEEIKGSTDLIEKMINGPWDKEFVVVKPGETITFEHFSPPSDQQAFTELLHHS